MTSPHRAAYEALGEPFRIARELQGTPQAPIEEEMGLSHGELSMIERGLGSPSLEKVVRLAEYFGMCVRTVRLKWLRARILKTFANAGIKESEIRLAMTLDAIDERHEQAKAAVKATRAKLGRRDRGNDDTEWWDTFTEFLDEDEETDA